MPDYIVLPVVFLAAAWLTGCVRRYAVNHNILDTPNPRSSHVVATPRGGGVAVVVVVLVVLPLLASAGALTWATAGTLALSGAAVATIGFLDDRHSIPARWRFLVHCVAAVCVQAGIGGIPDLTVQGFMIHFGWTRYVFGTLYVVWLINLTNFMDGIDGITGVECVTVLIGAALVSGLSTGGGQALPLVVASAVLGFLVWNWPPAKIFMGDAGSGFLGLVFAALSLRDASVSTGMFWIWLILLAVFIADATLTLTRRVIRRKRFYEAHNSHAYQRATQRWGAHWPVTVAVGAINVLWLLPIAMLVARGTLAGSMGALIAYTPIVAGALFLRAGQSD